eukprot:TRINITY_DN5605_c0_g1_i4.p1 TRINITY_DN5605_c0_g1~~TRINITY_DN5605_c0_g1_i4.p1  ORF type:complete len:127 (+),score=30.11 TRINITY_DN5605_c0_g1_i4:366-746(+)
MTQPRDLLERDLNEGVYSLAADAMQVLDMLAILPQFVHFRLLAGRAKELRLNHTVATWLAFVAVVRLLSMLSGLVNTVQEYREEGKASKIELFYCASGALNLLALSEFCYHYVKASFFGAAVNLPL